MQTMRKVRQAVYGAGTLLLLAPMIAGAQWMDPLDPLNPINTVGLSGSSISNIILTMMRWLLYIVGFFGIIAFVISGILYLTSAGDEKRIEQAKTTMIYAIIGVIVALSGLIIITAVHFWLWGMTATF